MRKLPAKERILLPEPRRSEPTPTIGLQTAAAIHEPVTDSNDFRAFATTSTLAEILEREDERYHISHWGINE